MKIVKLQITYITVIIVGLCCLGYGCKQKPAYQETESGIIITPDKAGNGVKKIRLQVVDNHIIRVTVSPSEDISRPKSLMITDKKFPKIPFKIKQVNDTVTISTSAIKAVVSLASGRVQFMDTSGRLILREKDNGSSFIPHTVENVATYKIRQRFDNVNHSALYGLGGNQLGLTNLKGENISLVQRNSEAFIPFLVSPGHFGILWDNNSITHFGDPAPWMPLDSFKLYNASGQRGGLTAYYFSSGANGDDTRLKNVEDDSREEKTIDYSFLKDLKRLPKGFKLDQPAVVEWKGAVSSPYSGLHSFRLYSGGYIKLWIDGKLMADRWRQCWNPAETLIKIPMEKGKKYALRIKWIPDGGESFLSLKWRAPLSDAEKNEISFASEMGKNIDYYFIAGKNTDSVISGYRKLTGKAPIMPLWAYGFWQSRERYHSQKEILNVVKEFRDRKIPLDNIVQDWFYWKENEWGSQEFDSSRYPDPGGMIKTLHEKYHTHFMISVWPKFYTGAPAFQPFWDKGWLYKKNVEDSTKDWVGYVSTFYDVFNKDARKSFWELINKNLFSIGVDAWWLDATEPDILSNTSIQTRKELMDPTALGPSAKNFNAYSLEQSKAFYTGQRAVKPNQRVFILTRSAFAGNQRYAAATWSGDIGATWKDMKDQIATGISFSMAGIPYWTMDIGGFATESRYSTHTPKAKDMEEWREQITRWYQFGAFCPLFRAHGQAPAREPFNVAPEGSPAYESILYYDKLRYRLLPYIYSLAGAVYLNNYTIMRGLAMDFPEDSLAKNITDEYLFGPDLLINPVYTYKAKERKVYLPEGNNWYDLYSGKMFRGGQTIMADAPYTRIPVFVKSGAIIPMGPALQYTGEKLADTITLFVFTGRDGHFDLYEDEGINYNYENGSYSMIPLEYHENDHTLTIGKRKGSFDGMLKHRIFKIMWSGAEKQQALKFNARADRIIEYDGRAVTIKME